MKSIPERKFHENSRLAKTGSPAIKLKKKSGAPEGNKNALRRGRHTAGMRAFRARLADFRRRANTAIAQAEALIRAREAVRALAVTDGKIDTSALAPIRS